MSQVLTALLQRNDVPTRAALQEALKALKFKLTVDESYVPLLSSGYLACTLNGEDAGFDIRFGSSAEYGTDDPDLSRAAGPRDVAIRLQAGADPREITCVWMVSAALAQRAGALVHDPKRNVLLAADELLRTARTRFTELEY